MNPNAETKPRVRINTESGDWYDVGILWRFGNSDYTHEDISRTYRALARGNEMNNRGNECTRLVLRGTGLKVSHLAGGQ